MPNGGEAGQHIVAERRVGLLITMSRLTIDWELYPASCEMAEREWFRRDGRKHEDGRLVCDDVR